MKTEQTQDKQRSEGLADATGSASVENAIKAYHLLEMVKELLVPNTKTKRELELEELLRSAHCIAQRKGEGTAWGRFAASIAAAGIGSVTARTYRELPSDAPNDQALRPAK